MLKKPVPALKPIAIELLACVNDPAKEPIATAPCPWILWPA